MTMILKYNVENNVQEHISEKQDQTTTNIG